MRRAFGTLLALAFCAASTAPFTGHAQEGLAPWDARDVGQQNGVFWTEFRGPNGDGASRSLDLPVEFGEEQHVRWKTAIHDRGFSSPVVWGDQVWMTTAREDGTELFAVCVDLDTGDIVHDIKVFDVAEPQLEYAHLNSHASPTPAVEEGRVYVHFGTYGTACLDTETGEQFWERRDLNCFHRVRAGSSPIVDDEALYVAYDGVDVQFVAALDKRTGDTRWLEDRGVESDLAAAMKALGFDDPADMRETAKEKPNDNKKSYATATLIEHEGRRQLISPAAEATISYDPATGEELWRVRHAGGFNVACRPLYDHGLVYFITGLDNRLLAVRPTGTGDVTDTHIEWSVRRGTPGMPSPLLVEELAFFINEAGVVSCLEAKTGNEVWRERVGGEHWASPVYGDGKIYFSDTDGKVSVIAAARNYELLARNRFDSGFMASPAVAGDALILRSLTHLYRVEK